MMGHIDGFLGEQNAFILTLITGFIEEEKQQAANADDAAKSLVYEVQANAGNDYKCRYNDVLCSMDLFEFTFHDFDL